MGLLPVPGFARVLASGRQALGCTGAEGRFMWCREVLREASQAPTIWRTLQGAASAGADKEPSRQHDRRLRWASMKDPGCGRF